MNFDTLIDSHKAYLSYFATMVSAKINREAETWRLYRETGNLIWHRPVAIMEFDEFMTHRK